MISKIKNKYNLIKTELLAGLTVSLALVPEAIAFAFVAGVEPLVGLYAAFMVGIITAIFGGRPGMISCLAPSGWVLKILEVEDYLFHNYKKQLLDGENHANYTS